jgi:hypothetical protein
MELNTNCKNCGGLLRYDKTNYGKTAKCEYCGTEYHIDLLGRVEEYKIKLEFMGEMKEFYIGKWEMNPIFKESFRGIDGTLITNKPIYKTKLNLIEI